MVDYLEHRLVPHQYDEAVGIVKQFLGIAYVGAVIIGLHTLKYLWMGVANQANCSCGQAP
jgi:hypothetical protein